MSGSVVKAMDFHSWFLPCVRLH